MNTTPFFNWEDKAPATFSHKELHQVFAAEIIFGSPKRNCAGSGICKVNSPTALGSVPLSCLNCKRATALISLDAPEIIVFQFVRSSMASEVLQKYFGNDVFLLEAPFQFRQSHWPEAEGRMIRAGAYPVERNETFLTVRFANDNHHPLD